MVEPGEWAHRGQGLWEWVCISLDGLGGKGKGDRDFALSAVFHGFTFDAVVLWHRALDLETDVKDHISGDHERLSMRHLLMPVDM